MTKILKLRRALLLLLIGVFQTAFCLTGIAQNVERISKREIVRRQSELSQGQEALVRAWRDLPSLRDPDRFDAWLHRLLVRACQDQLRKHRHELTEVELLQIPARAGEGAGARLEDRDELEGAQLAMALPERWRP